MKAVRLHKFHTTPVIDNVPDPKISGPLDVIVKIGGAGVCRTDLVCWPLLGAGTDPAALLAMTVGEVRRSRALDRLLARRAELGLPAGGDAPLLIDPASGAPVAFADLPLHLRKAHVTRVSIEANSGICRGMLGHRYNTRGLGETALSEDS